MIIVMALLMSFQSVSARAADDAIGIVKVATGETVVERGGETGAIVAGDSVFRHDALSTGEGSSLGVTFKDNTRVSLGPNSTYAVTEFTFEPAEEEYSFLTRLTRGTLLYVSGVIAKLAPETVAIETPTASIGVRGTRFLVRVGGEG
jgi:hypothetical protein